MQTRQYRKSRIWGLKEVKYTKTLAKNQVRLIIHTRDLPKFIRLCMEMPCWCSFEGDKYGRRKLTETSVFEFFYKYANSSFHSTHKHSSNSYSETRNVSTKFQKISNVRLWAPGNVFKPHIRAFPAAC